MKMQHLCRPINLDSSRNYNEAQTEVWPGGVMVMTLACDLRGREFNSRPFRCQVTTLGKLFTYMWQWHSFTKQYNLVPVARKRCPATGKVTVGLASHWPCVTDLTGLSTYGINA